MAAVILEEVLKDYVKLVDYNAEVNNIKTVLTSINGESVEDETIASKLNRVQSTKSAIATSIINKGGTVENIPFSQYPQVIDNIPTGYTSGDIGTSSGSVDVTGTIYGNILPPSPKADNEHAIAISGNVGSSSGLADITGTVYGNIGNLYGNINNWPNGSTMGNPSCGSFIVTDSCGYITSCFITANCGSVTISDNSGSGYVSYIETANTICSGYFDKNGYITSGNIQVYCGYINISNNSGSGYVSYIETSGTNFQGNFDSDGYITSGSLQVYCGYINISNNSGSGYIAEIYGTNFSGYFNPDGYMTNGNINMTYNGSNINVYYYEGQLYISDYDSSNSIYICGYVNALEGISFCGDRYILYCGYMNPVEVTISGQIYQALVFISGQ